MPKSITDLKPDTKNANKGTQRGRGMVEASLREVGAGRSILIDKDGRVIAGNKTLEAAVDIGLPLRIVETDGTELVAVQRNDLDLSDDTGPARKLAYYDNRASEVGLAWDAEQLLASLNDGLSFNGIFQQDELDALLAGLVEKAPVQDAEPQIDKAEELRQKWGVETGQIWQLGRHRLICGDCTDKATVARLMGGERAALAWFDPPFGINLQPQRGLTEAIKNDGQEEAKVLWAKFLPMLHSVMVDNSHLFLCQNWKEFDWTLPLVKKHFTLKSKVVWNKNVWGLGYYTRPKHEDIIYCWKGEPATIVEPVADVWDVARESAPEHSAEKPPELSAIAIAHFSQVGDVVVDWFSGLGGSTIACEQLNRQCRACEISPGYIGVALQRYLDSTGIEPVLVGS